MVKGDTHVCMQDKMLCFADGIANSDGIYFMALNPGYNLILTVIIKAVNNWVSIFCLPDKLFPLKGNIEYS